MNELTRDRLTIPSEHLNELPPEVFQSEIALSAGPDSRLYLKRKGGNLGAEQIRMLQVRLAELRGQQPFSRLLVTSATRGEGKTHVSANLALTLASEDNRRVLLIDADVRNPSVHSALGISNSHGFKDWLLNGGNPWKALRKVKRTGLCVMTGGTPALESIGPSRIACVQTLLDQIAPAFDLILLDSPPLLGTIDAKLLTSVADAVLLVVRAGFTSRHLVLQAQESLEGQNVLGIVLNRLDPNHACFNSYYDHTSYGSNGQPKDEGKGSASSSQTEVIRVIDDKKSIAGQ
jgi:capsular exopolysaccharide synthesis family protein